MAFAHESTKPVDNSASVLIKKQIAPGNILLTLTKISFLVTKITYGNRLSMSRHVTYFRGHHKYSIHR
jgi:hypothetical protein